MFWVFCTSCFARPSPEIRRKFFITNCAHIICEKCFSQEKPVCRQCSSLCKVIPCNAEMPNDVKELFNNINLKATTSVKALEYQIGEMSRLTAHQKAGTQKYLMAKTILKEIESKNNSLQKTIDCLEQKCITLENHIQELTMKINWYAKKCATPKPSSSSYQSPFPQMAFHESPDESGGSKSQRHMRQLGRSQPSTPFTPNKRSPFQTYSSGMSTPFFNKFQQSVASSSRINKIHQGFTPPSETIELLSQLNKSRRY